MKISCRGRYAVRAMIELALHHRKSPLSLAIIAKNEGISKKYLTQLMAPLRRSGLINVVRGRAGGLLLAHHPSRITLGDILHAVEGDMSLLECVKDPAVCYLFEECISRPTWLEHSDLIKTYLKQTTLADMLKKGLLAQMSDLVR